MKVIMFLKTDLISYLMTETDPGYINIYGHNTLNCAIIQIDNYTASIDQLEASTKRCFTRFFLCFMEIDKIFKHKA